MARAQFVFLPGFIQSDCALSNTQMISFNPSNFAPLGFQVNSRGRCKSSPKCLVCYDKSIPKEIIEKPVGLSLNRREIGVKSACSNCQAKGAILCGTCSGSGLYVDSILESQGIIVKVRCLGCGGSGNIMCTTCGGRGHAGHY
ncbi:hypothetical protein KSP39_PZI002883 [Platanthera zijinensis]|uniref:DnaJ/Hsp40 cysteine-rich domain superfamily protein n=1 Tax=Platanthera zijinensis TaxID=2320716 RepID=A0AAP0BZG8_9ASPA